MDYRHEHTLPASVCHDWHFATFVHAACGVRAPPAADGVAEGNGVGESVGEGVGEGVGQPRYMLTCASVTAPLVSSVRTSIRVVVAFTVSVTVIGELLAPAGTLNFNQPPLSAYPKLMFWELVLDASSDSVTVSPSVHLFAS